MSRANLPDNLPAERLSASKGQIANGLVWLSVVAPPKDAPEPFGVAGEFSWDGAASHTLLVILK